MREWPNSFTDLRSPYLVLKLHVLNSAPMDGRSIDLRVAIEHARWIERSSRAGMLDEGQEYTRVNTLLMYTDIKKKKKSISTLRLGFIKER